MTSPNRHITVIPGDGIGQEVVDAALQILKAASAPISWTICHAGEALFKAGVKTGVPAVTLESIKDTKVVLKSHELKLPEELKTNRKLTKGLIKTLFTRLIN